MKTIFYKVLLIMVVMTVTLFSWEVNTHRLIDRKAIEISAKSNLGNFLQLSYNKQRGGR
jgi:hypothetical protein